MAADLPQSIIALDDGNFSLRFDQNVYRLESVKKACYKFRNHFAVVIESDNAFSNCVIRFAPDSSTEDRESLLRALTHEVLDQDLREDIREQTEATRGLILAEAFSRTSLINQE